MMKESKLSKPVLLALCMGGTLLTVILVLVIITMARAGKPATGGGGADTPYPYQWAEKRNGTLTLTLTAPPEGFAWTAEMGADAETVAAEQGKAGKFTLSPLRENPVAVTFALARETDADERLAELELDVDVVTRGEKLRATVSGDRLTLPEPMLRGGEELGCPYKIWNEGSRLIVFLADGAEEHDWSVYVGDKRAVEADWQEDASDGWRAAFRAGEPGESSITLLSAAKALRLTFGVTSDGESLRATSHELTRLEGGAGEAAAELAGGAPKPPEGAENVEYDAADFGQKGSAGGVTFTLNGWQWSLLVSPEADLAERFAGNYDAAGQFSYYLDDTEVNFAPAQKGAYLWWTDDAGRSLLLFGVSDAAAAATDATGDEAPDYDTIFAVAEKTIAAQK